MGRQTRIDRWTFKGYNAIPLTASNVGGPWCKADTSSAGSPTMLGINQGGLRLQMTTTNEIQNLCLYFGDVLAYDIDELIRATFIVRAGQTFNAASMVAFGMCSARNDAIDNLTAHASFRCIANNTVVVETDDGTNDNDDKATGLTLSSTNYGRYSIDFATGVYTKEPPSVSDGRPSDVQFFGPNSLGSHRRVASGTRFDMSNYTAGLQPYVQLQKTADANADDFEVLEVEIEYNLPNYS